MYNHSQNGQPFPFVCVVFIGVVAVIDVIP